MNENTYNNLHLTDYDIIFTDDQILYNNDADNDTNIGISDYNEKKEFTFVGSKFKKIIIITTKKKFNFISCTADSTILPDDISKIYFEDSTIQLVDNNIKIVGGTIVHLKLENITIKNKFYLNVTSEQKGRTNITNVSIKNVTFENNVKFIKCNFNNVHYFEDIDFEKRADFSNSKFNSLNDKIIFTGINFKDLTYFTKTKFLKKIIFEKVTLFDNVSFQEATFKLNVIFRKITIKKDIDFTDLKIDNPIDAPLNKRTAQLIKASLNKQNNISQANDFFKFEQESYYKKLRAKIWKKDSENSTLAVLFLNKVVSSFGTDWIRPLFVMFSFGFVASFFYLLISNDSSPELFIKQKMSKDDMLFYMGGGFVISIIAYILYHQKKFIFLSFLIIPYAIVLWVLPLYGFPDFGSLCNDMSKLINPMNIFKAKDFFEDIAPYGMLVKLIMATLIYQFIIAFRNNTRKK